MLQRIVESYAELAPVDADATGLDLVTLTEPVEGWEPGTYRAQRIHTFTTGPLEMYGAWLARLDGYSCAFRALTAHGVQGCTLGPAACQMLKDALTDVWPHEAASGDGWATLTDLWIDAVSFGANNGLVRVR